MLLGAATLMLGLTLPVAAEGQQRHSTQWRTKAPEKKKFASDEAAREFVSYARCVVDRRYNAARALVLAPFASPQQTSAVSKVVRSEDGCLKSGFDELRMSFRAEVLAGGLAQALVLKEYPDLPAVVASYAADPATEAPVLAQLNAAEAYGRCVVQRDPAGAIALFQSRPATPEERRAVNLLRDDLGPCLAAGSKLTINEMFLRNSMGVAAYRLAQQIQPRGAPSGRGGK